MNTTRQAGDTITITGRSYGALFSPVILSLQTDRPYGTIKRIADQDEPRRGGLFIAKNASKMFLAA